MNGKTKSVISKKDIFYLMAKYAHLVSKRESEILLLYLSGSNRIELYLNDVHITEEFEKQYDSLIKRRLMGEPVQYITGFSEFMGRNFIVNKDVLIPRPETEILVEEVISFINRDYGFEERVQILDLCTGCGNIAISLAQLSGRAEIAAVDVSERALRVARENSITHRTRESIVFYEGSIFRDLPFDKKNKFDIIVSNPPYVKSDELERLQKEVRHEPKIALDGGRDGLEFYRRLAKVAPDYLKKRGSLFLEIGFNQAEAVKDIFSLKNLFEIREVKKDFADIDRVIWISLS